MTSSYSRYWRNRYPFPELGDPQPFWALECGHECWREGASEDPKAVVNLPGANRPYRCPECNEDRRVVGYGVSRERFA